MWRDDAQLFHHAREDSQRGFDIFAGVKAAKTQRILARACSGRSPTADSTCDGSSDPEEHADPVEQAMPRRSMAITNPSPSR